MNTESQAGAATIEAALRSLGRGDIARASALCTGLLEVTPDDPAALQLGAAIALAQSNGVEAARLAASSLEHRPDHVPTLILLGRAARILADRERALECFRRATDREPGRAEPAFLLCVTLLECGAPEANTVLQHLLKAFPDDGQGWRMLGDALYAAHKPDAALVAFNRALQSAPSGTLHLRRGIVLQSLERHVEALAAFDSAAALAPEHAEVHFRRGLCLKIAREPKAAQDAFEHVVQLDPSLGEAWFELALIQQDQGHLEEAVRNYRQALAARPDLAEAAVNLGICLQNTGDLSAAKRAYASALELRADTFGRIAQALSSAPIGEVWLDHQALRRSLGG